MGEGVERRFACKEAKVLISIYLISITFQLEISYHTRLLIRIHRLTMCA